MNELAAAMAAMVAAHDQVAPARAAEASAKERLATVWDAYVDASRVVASLTTTARTVRFAGRFWKLSPHAGEIVEIESLDVTDVPDTPRSPEGAETPKPRKGRTTRKDLA